MIIHDTIIANKCPQSYAGDDRVSSPAHFKHWLLPQLWSAICLYVRIRGICFFLQSAKMEAVNDKEVVYNFEVPLT